MREDARHNHMPCVPTQLARGLQFAIPLDFARRSHIDNVSDGGGLRDSSLANGLFDAVAKVSAQDADRSVWLAQLHNNYVSLGNGMVLWDRITNHA